MPIDPELLKILACPKCKGDLEYRPELSRFDCRACKLIYPVVDDIPNFLIDEALPLMDDLEEMEKK
jgi:hypothetical protein